MLGLVFPGNESRKTEEGPDRRETSPGRADDFASPWFPGTGAVRFAGRQTCRVFLPATGLDFEIVNA